MKKNIWLLALLMVGSALYAQENVSLGGADLLAAFKQYNPAALEKARTNAIYQEVLSKLAASYTASRSVEKELELIALVKNFDNSLYLQALRNAYFESRTLQLVSGTTLNSLEANTWEQLFPIVKSIYQNTLDVRYLQLKHEQQVLKQVKKDNTLSQEQRAEQISLLQKQIKQTKQVIRELKKDSTLQIAAVCDTYLTEMQAAFTSAQPQQLQAEQSSSRDIKANHKKPIAE